MRDAADDPTSLLNLLLRRKLISNEQASEILSKQIGKHRFVGQLLLEHGYITQSNLEETLVEQRQLRSTSPANLERALAVFDKTQAKAIDAARDLAEDVTRIASEKFAPIKRSTP